MSATMAGLGAFLSSAGKSAGKISQQYFEDVEHEEDRARKKKLEFREDVDRARAKGARLTGGKKIKSAMEAIMNPMDLEDAKTFVENADPKVIEQATKEIEKINPTAQQLKRWDRNKAANAAEAAAMPTPQQAKRWDDNKIKAGILDSLGGQESSDDDNLKEHPTAANGLQAYGKFGIVPELHIDKVGLDPKNPKDIAKWKADKELQKLTAQRIVDENYKAAGGSVEGTVRRHYGLTKDPNKKQYLKDGREMPSSNQYVEQVMARYNSRGLPTQGSKEEAATAVEGLTGSVERTASTGRQAIDKLISKEYKAPDRGRITRNSDLLGKLYSDMTPDEIEQNKDYLDRVTKLAESGNDKYKEELQSYHSNLDRQTTAAINAMKLDETTQNALLKMKNGVKSLTPDEIKALEARRKVLEGLKKPYIDLMTSLKTANSPKEREGVLASRPDLTKKDDPSFWGRITGQEGKTVIDEGKIKQRMDLIDNWLLDTDKALAGLGGLEAASTEEVAGYQEGTAFGGSGSNIKKYIKPIGTQK